MALYLWPLRKNTYFKEQLRAIYFKGWIYYDRVQYITKIGRHNIRTMIKDCYFDIFENPIVRILAEYWGKQIWDKYISYKLETLCDNT